MNVLIATVGLLLLAKGLDTWSWAVMTKDTGEARAPLPYESAMRVVHDIGEPVPPWTIVIASNDPAHACSLARGYKTGSRSVATMTVIAVRRDEAVAYRCTTGQQGAGAPMQLTQITRPSHTPSSGFVVTSEKGRIVYGSQDLSDLSRVGAILELFSRR